MQTTRTALFVENLQKIVNKVKEQSENLGLYKNVSKTKMMKINKAGEESNTAIDVNQVLEQVIKGL